MLSFFTTTLLALLGFLATASAVTRIDLETAGDFAILSKAGVTNTGVTSVTGDVGTSPIAGTALTGFALTMDSSNTFSSSSIISGQVFAADYTSPTPSKMTTAIGNLQRSFVDGSGRADPDFVNLGAGLIEGETLTPGLYKWGSDVMFTSSLVFDGSSTDIFMLQVAGNLIVGNGARVALQGGAKAENIFFVVSGKVVLGTTSHVEGVIISATSIVLETGSSLNGAALAQTAVTLDAATVVKMSV